MKMKGEGEPLTKIELIKNAAVEIMSRKGVAATSVSQIAKQAGVSDGYLYRYYACKEDLVDSLLNDMISNVHIYLSDLIDTSKNLEEMVTSFNSYIYYKSTSEPHTLKFLIMLQNDFSYQIPKSMLDEVEQICIKVVKGKHLKVNPNLTLESIYVALVGLPFQYHSIYHKNMFDSKKLFSNKEEFIKQISHQTLKLLQ
ncbi:MAG: TetR/AcrR family transcriptional regulator [Rikenellaceae bacterium]